jgi:phenylacetate-CoA ligase
MWLRKIWYLNELRRNQWLKPFELRKIQEKKLRAIIKYAYSNILFYNRRFKAANVRPNDIQTVEDLVKIPITSRAELKTGFRTRDVLRPNLDLSKCNLSRTAGTSGNPLTIVYDGMAEDFQKAVAVRSFLESGGRFRDKWAIITIPHRMHLKNQWFQRLGFLSPIYLSVFDSVEKNISLLQKIQPNVIGAYPSYMRLLAKGIRENNVKDINPRMIITSAETLSQEAREYINSTFNLELSDQFGCAEIGRSAWECEEHVGYHMDVDALVLEFVRNGEPVGSGERGRLLYTCLFNYAMPLIRYDVGDICVPTDELCPCGRGLPLIEKVEGRSDDFVTATDGTVLSPTLLLIVMKEIPGIAQYRLVQETRSRFKVMLVRDQDFTERTLNQVENGIKEVVGNDALVEVQIVDEIPKDKAGKIRAIISKVKADL